MKWAQSGKVMLHEDIVISGVRTHLGKGFVLELETIPAAAGRSTHRFKLGRGELG
jgi:hypothetical protein